MYAFIRGTLFEKKPGHVVLDAAGVGYKIFLPLNCFSKLPEVNAALLLYTSLIVREEAHTLYGFLHTSERELFENLIVVSGIGPRTAIAIIGHMEADTLKMAIEQGNIALLSKVPGIGKKTAERMIIELRDKTKSWESGFTLPVKGSLATDAIQALIHLGYNVSQAQKALQRVFAENKEEEDLGRIITAALKKL